MRFGEMIQQARRTKGLTLRTLAAMVEMAPSHISEIEHGKKRPPRDRKIIRGLAGALSLDPDELERAAREDRDVVADFRRTTRQLLRKQGPLALAFCRAGAEAPPEKMKEALKVLKGEK